MNLKDICSGRFSTNFRGINSSLAGIILFLLFFSPAMQAQKRRVKLPAELQEISGMVGLTDDRIWAINDGGNAPVVFRFDLQSRKITERYILPVPNRDWEDLQMDCYGNLWIGDIGNNRNNRKDLRFYRFNPVTRELDSLLFSYPDQQAFPPAGEVERNFDCEAFIWHKDTLHLFTKSRFAGRHFTKHYTIPAVPGIWQAELRDSLYLPNRVVSGAAISADGKTLALTAYYVKKRIWPVPYTGASVFFISGYKGTHFLKGNAHKKRLPKFLIARQFESITQYRNGVWLAANEGILWQKPRVWRVRSDE